MHNHFIFTITAGRTGTAWLASFIRENLKIPTIHEPLDIDDFGNQMPDIRVMRSFNNRGMDEVTRSFWARKFDKLKELDNYCETNHTLAKCGLVEALAEMELDRKISFICVRRNWIDQCASYLTRYDFDNITLIWQWYLSHDYPRKIVNPDILLKMAPFGGVLWYIAEIEARQSYYRQLFGDRFNFIDCDLETLTTEAGAAELLSRLGYPDSSPILPQRKNANQPVGELDKIKQKLAKVINNINFDADAIADNFIRSGHRLAGV